jgi:GTP1/Obg family GTP-binding protein
VFRDFFAKHADVFYEAPQTICGEQNLEYYGLFQEYLKLYENTLQDYIESLNVSVEEFYRELADVMNDPDIKDKKLLHFANYLVACTDYASFYKVMVRAAKKEKRADAKAESKASGKDETKRTSVGGAESKPEGKAVAGESKADYK